MRIKIITLFPKMFEGFVGESIIKRAIEKNVCEIEIIDMRDYSLSKHRHVDDTPYGGGAGMVLACDVVDRAIKANSGEGSYKIMMTPQGNKYNQQKALELAKKEEIVLICGHYEGFDERIRTFVDEEISVGDYVLTGGEIPSMIVADSVIRLLGEAIKQESHEDDSFSNGLLEYPQYTRPAVWNGLEVPEVLLKGNHKLICEWKRMMSLKTTYEKRKGMLKKAKLTSKEENYIKSLDLM